MVELVFLHTLLAQSRCLALLNPQEKSELATQSLRCLLATRDSHGTKSASRPLLPISFAGSCPRRVWC